MSRFESTPGEHKPRPVRNGLALFALTSLLLYCGFTRSIPFVPKGGKIVAVHFDRATNVKTGNIVRVHGVDVGRVSDVKRDPSGKGALVKMRIEEHGFKLHSDARAGLYWRTLLGRNMYIELTPGSNRAPLLGDATIPTSRTESQVEFDELLQSYDTAGRAGARTFLREGDKTLTGSQVGQAIGHLKDGLTPVAPAMRALRGTRPGTDLPGLARTAAKTFEAVSRSETALGGLIDGGNTVLGVTAARRADLAAMLQRAPATMRDTRTTLARLRTTLDVVDPIAAGLRPGVRGIAPAIGPTTTALRRLRSLTPAALPALRDLRPALASLDTASRQGAPLFQNLAPTLDRLQDKVLPFLAETNDDTQLKNYEAIGPFFSALASSSQEFDAFGHVQRFMPGQGLDSVGPAPCSLVLFNPKAPGDLVKCKQALKLLPQLVGGAPGRHGGRVAPTDRRGSR